MTTREEIVQQADLLGYRGEKRDEYLKQEFKLFVQRAAKKEELERAVRKEELERRKVRRTRRRKRCEERRGRTRCEYRTREDETRNRDENVTGENLGWNSEERSCR
ncbi:hypothetical protein ElyMa_002218100 [Elysia marginata]|uniref:Uncharacterized protein n=1 Tax=Elysia marginata TaxID=1093978 RepID=A0AAV4FTK0_9GAST|nr:hypothetical protein ElyMa_002218100 [Elysia marginata]